MHRQTSQTVSVPDDAERARSGAGRSHWPVAPQAESGADGPK